MHRRTFLTTVAGSLLTMSLAAEAQPTGKVYRVGLVFTTAPVGEMTGLHPVHPLVRSFLDELRRSGKIRSGEYRTWPVVTAHSGNQPRTGTRLAPGSPRGSERALTSTLACGLPAPL